MTITPPTVTVRTSGCISDLIHALEQLEVPYSRSGERVTFGEGELGAVREVVQLLAYAASMPRRASA